MRVLGIETSCDETGVAIYDSGRGLLGHALYSQVALHAEFGGVVPELASRDHVRKLIPLIRQVMAEADTPVGEIGGVAYTAGPGLIGALLVGAALGRSLAYAWGVPGLGIHHMEAHLLAPMLETPAPEMPFVALLVSGGHTMLVEVAALGRYRVLGETAGRCGRRGVRQDRQTAGSALSRRPRAGRSGRAGDAWTFRIPASDARPSGSGLQL